MGRAPRKFARDCPRRPDDEATDDGDESESKPELAPEVGAVCPPVLTAQAAAVELLIVAPPAMYERKSF